MMLAVPQMLWMLLVVIPPLVFFLWWAWRKREELIRQFISERLLSILKVGVSPARQKLRMVLLVVAVMFLILTLARPQWGYTLEEAKQHGLDIIVAIDTSNSMLAKDMLPDRLTRAKLAAKDLMRKAKADRLGVVAFAGTAFLECPLTLDDAAFSQSVDALDTHTISEGGTALAEAIDTAQKAFGEEKDNHKVLVLFTDGEDNDGGAVAAAQRAAKEAGMRIYTIGIGSAEGVELQIHDEQGHVDYIRDEAGNKVISRLNEDLLQRIASAANGFYLNLRGNKTIDTLYDHPQGIGSLPKSTNYSQKFRRYHERFQWPLCIAIGLLLFEMFLPDRKRRRKKDAAAAPATLGAASKTVALLLLAALPLSVWGSPAGALREYEDGKYENALQDYNQLLEKKKDDPRLHFNAGTAAYQSHHLDQAAREFNEVLTSPAPDLKMQEDAYYNLGNTYYRMGQAGGSAAAPGGAPAAPDMDAIQKAWEQAIQHYDSALKLNPKDEDARFNQTFVKTQLEELKKQQQQQQQSNSDKNKDDKKKDDKQDKQNQSKNDSQNQQNKDSQSQQDKDKNFNKQDKSSQANDQKKDDKKSGQDQQKQDEQKSQAQKKGDKSDKKDQQQQAQSGDQKKDKDKSDEEAEREQAMMAAGQMTPQQAQQLLDAQKGEEEVLRFSPPQNKESKHSGFIKNW